LSPTKKVKKGKKWVDEVVDRRTVQKMRRAAEVVFEKAMEGNLVSIFRFDGKPKESVDVTTNTNVKVRYESLEEVRAAIPCEATCLDLSRHPSWWEINDQSSAAGPGQISTIRARTAELGGL
jgi:hypothetical protein